MGGEKKKLLKELPAKFDKSLWVVSLVKISTLQLITFTLTMLMTIFAEFWTAISNSHQLEAKRGGN